MLTAVEAHKAAAESEKRIAQRHPAATLTDITGIRISPIGGSIQLVNISTTGALIRCSTRLMPGTTVTLLFEGTHAPAPAKGTVVRCLVADICRPAGLFYHVGIAFKDPIVLRESGAPATGAETTAATTPVREEPVHEQPVLVNRW